MSPDPGERLVAGCWTLHPSPRRTPRGLTWRATDPEGRQVAVEELRVPAGMFAPGGAGASGDGRGGAEFWDRVAAEVRAAAALDHPGLLRLEDVVVEDGVVYVVSELVDAHTLAELIARHGSLPVRRVAQLGLELLDALEAAHAAGLPTSTCAPAASWSPSTAGPAWPASAWPPSVPPRAPRRPPPHSSPPSRSEPMPPVPPATSGPWGQSCSLQLRVRPPFPGDGSDITHTAILTSPH